MNLERLGLLVPETNTIVELETAELSRALPDLFARVSIHVSRIPSGTPYETNPLMFLQDIWTNACQAALLLRTIRPTKCGFFCTAAESSAEGTSPALADVAGAACAGGALGPIGALREVARTLNLSSLGILTPYIPKIGDIVRGAIESVGLRVTCGVDLGLTTDFEFYPPERLIQIMRESPLSSCENVFISCTNLPTLRAIQTIERSGRQLIMSSNLVLFWWMLRTVLGNAPAALTTPRLFAAERGLS